MNKYEHEIRERLTDNANDFDSIVSDMLAHIEKLQAALASYNPEHSLLSGKNEG